MGFNSAFKVLKTPVWRHSADSQYRTHSCWNSKNITSNIRAVKSSPILQPWIVLLQSAVSYTVLRPVKNNVKVRADW